MRSSTGSGRFLCPTDCRGWHLRRFVSRAAVQKGCDRMQSNFHNTNNMCRSASIRHTSKPDRRKKNTGQRTAQKQQGEKKLEILMEELQFRDMTPEDYDLLRVLDDGDGSLVQESGSVSLSLPLIRVVRAAFRLAWARTVTDTVTDRGERRHGAHKDGRRCRRWSRPAPQ